MSEHRGFAVELADLAEQDRRRELSKLAHKKTKRVTVQKHFGFAMPNGRKKGGK